MIRNIYLICKIIEYDSKLLYNFICSNKNLNLNIFKYINILSLEDNNNTVRILNYRF